MNCIVLKKLKCKKDGVYVTYYYSDINMPFLPQQSNLFSDINSQSLYEKYISGGRKAVDRYVIKKMITLDFSLNGKDKSIKRYRDARNSAEYRELYTLYVTNGANDNFLETDETAQTLLNIIVDYMNKQLS